MVTFADVLGIWPFTLDELIQAFHDYVSILFCTCSLPCYLLSLKSLLKVLPFLKVRVLCFMTMDVYLLSILQDPRLLGEIHIALLRSIIKDIEDVVRTPSTGLGANQNTSANSSGGHPQVVEGVSFFSISAALNLLSLFFPSSPKKTSLFYLESTVRHLSGVLI